LDREAAMFRAARLILRNRLASGQLRVSLPIALPKTAVSLPVSLPKTGGCQ
jgi:hypothetical protein